MELKKDHPRKIGKERAEVGGIRAVGAFCEMAGAIQL